MCEFFLSVSNSASAGTEAAEPISMSVRQT